MLMSADVREGGVKNRQKSADVVCGWPLATRIQSIIFGSLDQEPVAAFFDKEFGRTFKQYHLPLGDLSRPFSHLIFNDSCKTVIKMPKPIKRRVSNKSIGGRNNVQKLISVPPRLLETLE